MSRTTEERWSDGVLHHSVVTRYQPAPDVSYATSDSLGPVEDEIGEPEDALAPSRDRVARRGNVLRHYQRGKRSQADAGHGRHASIRHDTHRSHDIEVRTTYEVSINGQPLDAHFGVGNDGAVHYHGLPNYSSASAIDLLKELIDTFPDDYPPVDDGEEA